MGEAAIVCLKNKQRLYVDNRADARGIHLVVGLESAERPACTLATVFISISKLECILVTEQNI